MSVLALEYVSFNFTKLKIKEDRNLDADGTLRFWKTTYNSSIFIIARVVNSAHQGLLPT
jgi:hypothetical protein